MNIEDALHYDAEHELGQVRTAVTRVASLQPLGLLVAIDEGTGGVDEDDVQCLSEQVAIPEEQLPFQRLANVAQKPGSAVEVLEFEALKAVGLDSSDPLRAAQV